MPKMKTRRAAKKRFKVTSSGKVKHSHAYASHNLGHRKSQKRKRSFRKDQDVAPADMANVKRMIGA